jgi:mannose-6-phosphate isomerase-like protein (cupin superfamily)
MPPESFPDPSTGGSVSWKTLLSCEKTATDTFTAGIAVCPPGKLASCPALSPPSFKEDEQPGHLKSHRHTHAEIYHVIGGKGVMGIDGEEYVVERGSVVFIPEDAEHGIRNTGREELVWLYVFAADGFGEVMYRFSEEKNFKAKL